MHGKANRNIAVRRVLEGEPVTKVSESLGIPAATISTWVPSKGLKHRILMDLATIEETDDVEALAQRVRSDPHSVVHQLWALQKQHLVAFRESKSGISNGASILRKVRLDGVAREALRPTVAEIVAADPVARMLDALTPDPVLPLPEPEPRPEPGPMSFPDPLADYPAIAALLDRHRNLTEAARLAEEAGETEVALTLLEKAEGTPLEREVIDYMRTHDD